MVPGSSQCYRLQEDSYLGGSSSNTHMADYLGTLRTVLNQVWVSLEPTLSHPPPASEPVSYRACGSETVYMNASSLQAKGQS